MRWCHALQVRVAALTTKRVEHNGIRVQLLGQIELASERGHYHDFVSLGELDRTGTLERKQQASQAGLQSRMPTLLISKVE
jgi:hypothetical protein